MFMTIEAEMLTPHVCFSHNEECQWFMYMSHYVWHKYILYEEYHDIQNTDTVSQFIKTSSFY